MNGPTLNTIRFSSDTSHRVVRRALGLVVLSIALVVVIQSLIQIRAVPEIRFGPLVVASLCGLCAQCCFSWITLGLIRNQSTTRHHSRKGKSHPAAPGNAESHQTNLPVDSLSFQNAIALCYVPMLGKYIPGRIWTVTMSLWMYSQLRITQQLAFQLISVLMLLSLCSALLTSALCGLPIVLRFTTASTTTFVTVACLLILSILSLPFASRFLRTKCPSPDLIQVPMKPLLQLFAANIVAWVLFGVGFFYVVNSVVIINFEFLLACIAIFPLAQIIGYLSVFVPAGLGVREAVLVAGLAPVTGQAEAVIIAIVCRIWQTILELLFALVGWNAFRNHIRRTTDLSFIEGEQN